MTAAAAATTLRGLPLKSLVAASETDECSPPSGASEPSDAVQFLSVPQPWPAASSGPLLLPNDEDARDEETSVVTSRTAERRPRAMAATLQRGCGHDDQGRRREVDEGSPLASP